MFCVLSGFLIYRSVRNIHNRDDLRYYIARRIFRVYPLYLLSVAACLMLGQVVADHNEIGTLSYLVAELMMFRSIDFPVFANPVTWSLYVEVIFYVFLPVFVLFVGLRRILPASIAMLVLLVIADQVPGREFQLWKYFFFGIVASELSLRYEKELKSHIGVAILAIGTILLVIDLAGPAYDWVAHAGFVKRNLSEYTIGLGLSFAMIAAAVPHVAAAGRVLNVFPLRFIGVVSYSVFIVHPFYLMANFPDLVLRKVGSQPIYGRPSRRCPTGTCRYCSRRAFSPGRPLTFLLIERPALIAGSQAIKQYRQQGVAAGSRDVITGAPIFKTFAKLSASAAGMLLVLAFITRGPSTSSQDAQASAAAGPPRCEIQIGPERCPGMPTFEPAKTQLIFPDDWRGSGSDMKICMARAAEFFHSCRATTPVTARFYNGKILLRSVTWR